MLFFFPCLLWPSFFSLLLFLFSVFSLSRSGAPDVKRPRYGFIPFYFGSELFFIFLEELTQPLAPRPSQKCRFSSSRTPLLFIFFIFVLSSLSSRPFISSQPPPLPISLALYNILLRCWHPLPYFIPSFIYLPCFWLLFLPLLLPAAISLCCVLHQPVTHPPSPCPVQWLTSWTFISDHLWPRDLIQGLKVTFFLLSLFLGFKKQTGNKLCVLLKKMCPHATHLTLQGENVVECAEFLFTTLLTFLLFGTQTFLKGSSFKLSFYLNTCFERSVLNICLQKSVLYCFEYWMSAAFLCTIAVQPHGTVPHDTYKGPMWYSFSDVRDVSVED